MPFVLASSVSLGVLSSAAEVGGGEDLLRGHDYRVLAVCWFFGRVGVECRGIRIQASKVGCVELSIDRLAREMCVLCLGSRLRMRRRAELLRDNKGGQWREELVTCWGRNDRHGQLYGSRVML